MVIWTLTWPGQQEMPVNPEPHPSGNIELSDGPRGSNEPTAQVVESHEDPGTLRLFEGEPTTPLYRPHWATCPHSKRWRR